MSRTPFVPNDFPVPKIIQTEKFLIRLLEMKGVAEDYDAYMTSIDHLQKIFDPNDGQPRRNGADPMLVVGPVSILSWELGL